MNTDIDKNLLLATLSKNYVMVEVGINPAYFAPTADAAWITIAARLLKALNGHTELPQ